MKIKTYLWLELWLKFGKKLLFDMKESFRKFEQLSS